MSDKMNQWFECGRCDQRDESFTHKCDEEQPKRATPLGIFNEEPIKEALREVETKIKRDELLRVASEQMAGLLSGKRDLGRFSHETGVNTLIGWAIEYAQALIDEVNKRCGV